MMLYGMCQVGRAPIDCASQPTPDTLLKAAISVSVPGAVLAGESTPLVLRVSDDQGYSDKVVSVAFAEEVIDCQVCSLNSLLSFVLLPLLRTLLLLLSQAPSLLPPPPLSASHPPERLE